MCQIPWDFDYGVALTRLADVCAMQSADERVRKGTRFEKPQRIEWDAIERESSRHRPLRIECGVHEYADSMWRECATRKLVAVDTSGQYLVLSTGNLENCQSKLATLESFARNGRCNRHYAPMMLLWALSGHDAELTVL